MPLALFVGSWLRLPFAILCLELVLMALCASLGKGIGLKSKRAVFAFSVRYKQDSAKPSVYVSYHTLSILICLAFIWCLLGGQGGMFYQTDDWSIRNALYRDLLTHEWPVYYNGGAAALSYYIAYWLPPALVGKLALALGANIDVIWTVANIALLVWTVMGMCFVILLSLVAIRPQTDAWVYGCVALLVLFSTPDILGCFLSKNLPDANAADYPHLEWWAQVAQYSSISTCLFWVFNQAVVPWICTLCMYCESGFRSYLLLFVCCANCGPFPALGLAFLMLARGAGRLMATYRLGKQVKPVLKEIISVQNIAALLILVPIVLFFCCNAAVSNTATAPSANALKYPLYFPVERRLIKCLAYFVFLEGLLLPLFVFRDHHKTSLYWGMLATLLICPFVRVGQAGDFCMRVSMPAILVLFVFVSQSLIMHVHRTSRIGAITALLIVALALGSITPICEMYRSICHAVRDGFFQTWHDKGTLEGQDFSISNFGLEQPDQTFFFKEVSKRRE